MYKKIVYNLLLEETNLFAIAIGNIFAFYIFFLFSTKKKGMIVGFFAL
jgi:hypothetical protein